MDGWFGEGEGEGEGMGYWMLDGCVVWGVCCLGFEYEIFWQFGRVRIPFARDAVGGRFIGVQRMPVVVRNGLVVLESIGLIVILQGDSFTSNGMPQREML